MARSSGSRSSNRSRSSGGRSSGSSSRSSGSRSSGGRSSGSSRSTGSPGSTRPSGGGSITRRGDRKRLGMNDDGRMRDDGFLPDDRGEYYGGGGRFGGGRGCCSAALIKPFCVIALVIAVIGIVYSKVGPKMTATEYMTGVEESYDLERLESGLDYDSACVIDELGWIEDTESLGDELEYFYDETGVQPYIYLAAYDGTLESEDDMLDYAGAWYDENIDDEYSFLYVYFAYEDEEEPGYMCYVAGTEASAIINEDTIDVFWDNLDYYWDTDLETGEMFESVYTQTANMLMEW